MKPTNKTYEIRTLADIYNLPSYEHVEQCLEEIKVIMLQAKATNDLFVGLVQHKGIEIPGGKCFEWPEKIDWLDDGKRNIGTDYVAPDGSRFLSMRVGEDKE